MTECQRCGDCCRFVTVVTGPITNVDLRDYFIAHGFVVRAKSVVIPSVCQHLKPCPGFELSGILAHPHPRVRWYCDIYDHRPEICRKGRCRHE
jgi:Fe-S-cluster containining protein